MHIMWKTLSKSEAAKIMLLWKSDEVPTPNFDEKYTGLREKLLTAEKETIEQIKKYPKKSDYYHDLLFGLELYEILINDFNFTQRDASNDEIWIYLSIKVIPDIVYTRWGITEARYYKQSRRIWLKTIWWYIHLSWDENKEKTFNLLKNNTTDEIVQLVERIGPKGYRIELTREIMKQLNSKTNGFNRVLFRKIMKLNTARLKVVEPSLTIGGVKQYVKELIDYFDYTNEKTITKEDAKITTNT